MKKIILMLTLLVMTGCSNLLPKVEQPQQPVCRHSPASLHADGLEVRAPGIVAEICPDGVSLLVPKQVLKGLLQRELQ